jgi:flagellar biosynthesis chaperone FliJ
MSAHVDLSHAATRQELRRLARQYDAYTGQLTDTHGHGLNAATYQHTNDVAEALRAAASHIEDLEQAERDRNERAERIRIDNERDRREDAEYLKPLGVIP